MQVLALPRLSSQSDRSRRAAMYSMDQENVRHVNEPAIHVCHSQPGVPIHVYFIILAEAEISQQVGVIQHAGAWYCISERQRKSLPALATNVLIYRHKTPQHEAFDI